MSLKEIRTSKGITQKQIALQMAMEQTTYSKKENGKSPINEDEWKRLSDFLETPIEQLKKNDSTISKNENCTFHDNSIGVQIVSMPKETLDIILKYTIKLEEEIKNLKDQNNSKTS
jgi:transcriptional regulator with XRE-family HTH domain